MSSAKSIESWSETYRRSSRIYGDQDYSNQIYGQNQLRNYRDSRKQRLFTLLDEIESLEKQKPKHKVKAPATTMTIANQSTMQYEEVPAYPDMSRWHDEKTDQWFDSEFIDTLHKKQGESFLLQKEIRFCNKNLKE